MCHFNISLHCKKNNTNTAIKHLKKAIDIKIEEAHGNEKEHEVWKQISSKVDKACKDKESKDCTEIVASSAIWLPF
jgi:hypothetical protein